MWKAVLIVGVISAVCVFNAVCCLAGGTCISLCGAPTTAVRISFADTARPPSGDGSIPAAPKTAGGTQDIAFGGRRLLAIGEVGPGLTCVDWAAPVDVRWMKDSHPSEPSPPMPDLFIAEGTVVTTGQQNEVRVHLVVRNQGTGPVGASFTVSWYSHQGEFAQDKRLARCTEEVAPSDANPREWTLDCTYTYPLDQHGLMHWVAVVDANNRVRESNENNNVLNGTVAVVPILSQPPAQTQPVATQGVYQVALGIDYTHPELYLAQGEQTRISNPTALASLRGKEKGLAQLGAIFAWLQKFDTYAGGGVSIGKVTVDELLASRRLSGCHDFALVYAAVARELGYPAVVVEAACVEWITRFRNGEEGPQAGHVFVEVFLADRWILVDSTGGDYVERGYNPANPVLREPGGGYYGGATTGYYVMWKGLDTVACGIHSNEENHWAMQSFARGVDPTVVEYPAYVWKTFAG